MSRLMRMGRGRARQTAAPGVRRSPPRGARRAHTSSSVPGRGARHVDRQPGDHRVSANGLATRRASVGYHSLNPRCRRIFSSPDTAGRTSSFRAPRLRLDCLNGEMDRVVLEFGGCDERPLLAVFLNSDRPADETLHSLCWQGSKVEVDSDRGRFVHGK